MTADELNQVEGKVNERLRESKRTLAALRVQLQEYADNLKRASDHMRFIITSPLAAVPSSQQSGKEFLDSMIPEDIETKLVDYQAEALRKHELEETLRQFNNG